ncbi:hypothetical protein ASD83_12810 [Devosia sp. Root685]|uniref:Wadjet anti-phage system protein JetA family protein n=1 Tax=Devosia sp. Root685 TaxID=1736587 RepID=UPI0006F8DE0A|nr:Wadjet anti-phage system protein JetA family protein [Devosia sp. Root685]KRA97942.1 hypothetical protein ASD83_12810 [Devosia sp. Root685]
MIFGTLHPNIFMLFAGENRRLYEEVLLRIYDDCFGSDLLFPTRNELVGIAYDVLASHPELWHDEGNLVTLDQVSSRGRRLRTRKRAEVDREATQEAMVRARHIYARLVDTGWLEESRYGMRVTVDMPSSAMRLADFLSTLRQGGSEQLGGLIVEVRNALDAVRVSAAHNALGLHKAAKDAVGFGRYLRSVLSSLREIERHVLASNDLSERLQHFFEDFVDRILLKDYAAISTTAHPYRFRYAILDSIQRLEDSPVDIDSLAAAYSDSGIAAGRDGARDLVFDDLYRIRRVLGQIDEAFLRIQQQRARLEVRLRNTVRYAGRRADAFLRLSEKLAIDLDRLIEHRKGVRRDLSVPGFLQPVVGPYSAGLLARPRGDRPVVDTESVTVAEPEPIHLLRRQLERDYLDRITIVPEKVLSFLDIRVSESVVFARDLGIADLDDFLAFEALRRAARGMLNGQYPDALSRRLKGVYEFRAIPESRVDNDWLDCEDFSIRRIGTLGMTEVARAG